MNNFLDNLEKLSIPYKTCEPLKKHTSFKIGGNAEYFITPKSINQCQDAINCCNNHSVKYKIIGKGSNLLVSDKGYDGAIICTSFLNDIKILDGNKIYCEAGVTLANLCLFALNNSLSGLEFAYGIPGNVGGAVYMNAGAYNGEMKYVVESCTFLDSNNNITTFENDKLDFSYRHSIFCKNNGCILSVILSLTVAPKDEIKSKMDDLISRRKEKQPLDFPSAGSTFKRPDGSYASLLVDQCGLKGFCIGDAQVSEKHAGFVINRGNATCQDVLELIQHIQNVVYDKTGYKLETEVEII